MTAYYGKFLIYTAVNNTELLRKTHLIKPNLYVPAIRVLYCVGSQGAST